MGDEVYHNFVSKKLIKKVPGFLRWSKCADAIILHYLSIARDHRAAHLQETYYKDPALPSSSTTVDEMYDTAHSDDLQRLYKVRLHIHEIACNI